MEKDIIAKVKEVLGLHGEYTGVDLLKKLTKERANSHPDKYQDLAQKEFYNERFQLLNGLFEELKKYLSEQHQNLPVRTNDDKTSDIYIDLLNAIGDISDLQDKIGKLTDANEMKDYIIKDLNTQIDELKDNKYKEEKNDIISSLNKIYKPSTGVRIVSGFSLLMLITTQLKSVKELLFSFFDNQEYVMKIIFVFFICCAFYIIYKIILKHCILYYQSKLLNPSHIQRLTVFKSDNGNFYFTEECVESYIEQNICSYIRLLFVFNKEIIYRQLSNYIIVNLNQKKIIKSVKVDKLIHIFEVRNDFTRGSRDFPF